MDNNIILLKLEEILKVRFHYNNEITQDLLDVPLTSPRLGFGAIQLYQFLMCVEEAFGIILAVDEIIQHGFGTLAQIILIVQWKLNIE